MEPYAVEAQPAAGRARRALGCIALVLALSGCASVEIGSAFDLRPFETGVQRGVTTRAQVQAWLGQRFEEWIYYHGEGQLPRISGAKLKILQIKFDSEGIVRAYNWSGGS
jgi:hypothetical protein